MGRKKPTWYRRLIDTLLPSMWTDRRKFLTGTALAGLAWMFNRLFPAPGVVCVPQNTVLMPPTGELVAVGELVLVKIGAGDSLSVGLGG